MMLPPMSGFPVTPWPGNFLGSSISRWLLRLFPWGVGPGTAGLSNRLKHARHLTGPGVTIGAALDTGPTTLRRGSAVLRLGSTGSWTLVEKGIFDDEFIRRAAQRSILFVCTGNTCRSPMAEAIARGLTKDDPSTTVGSAGVGAMDGAGFSPEGAKALAKIGIVMHDGRSRMLTPGMLASADEVYVMTGSHRKAVLSINPSLGSKVKLVDPAGRDVVDPIGSGQHRYDSVAADLKGMIQSRLQEDDA